MPPKLLQKHFTWIDVLLLPFRLVQVCIITALMLVWNLSVPTLFLLETVLN